MCNFFRCILQLRHVQRVDSSRSIPPPEVLGAALQKAVSLQALQVVGDSADADTALAGQKLLRRPAAALRVGAVGERHQHQLATTRQALVA